MCYYIHIRTLNIDTILSNKNEAMFSGGYENCPKFAVSCGVIFKLDIL
jgi:hypothetical protein